MEFADIELEVELALIKICKFLLLVYKLIFKQVFEKYKDNIDCRNLYARATFINTNEKIDLLKASRHIFC